MTGPPERHVFPQNLELFSILDNGRQRIVRECRLLDSHSEVLPKRLIDLDDQSAAGCFLEAVLRRRDFISPWIHIHGGIVARAGCLVGMNNSGSQLLTVTSAPATAAPEESATLPKIVPRALLCMRRQHAQ